MSKETEKEELREVVTGLSCMWGVHGNYEGFTQREILQAKKASRVQAMLGSPSKKDLQGLVSGNMIANCPFSLSDVTNAKIIYGPDIPRTQGATLRRRPALVVTNYVAVPRLLVEANKVITLAADMLFEDGAAFLLTVLQRLKFVTANHVPVRTASQLSKHIKRVLDVYGRAGFRIRTILMDGEFEKVKLFLSTLECNTTAAKERMSNRNVRFVRLKRRRRVCWLCSHSNKSHVE